MSAEFQIDPLRIPHEAAPIERDVALAHQRASDARRHAAAIGDYAAAERWHEQERTLSGQLAWQDRQRAAAPRA